MLFFFFFNCNKNIEESNDGPEFLYAYLIKENLLLNLTALLIWCTFIFQGLPGSGYRGEKGEPGKPGPRVSMLMFISNIITVTVLFS